METFFLFFYHKNLGTLDFHGSVLKVSYNEKSNMNPLILDLLGPVLDAGGKLERQEKNPRNQVWTGNQVHISAGTENRTRDSLVQS